MSHFYPSVPNSKNFMFLCKTNDLLNLKLLIMKKLLLIFLLVTGCLITNAQWNDDPSVNNLITPADADLYNFDLRAAKNGSVFISYLRPMGNIASILQIVDANGNMLFPEEGKMISHKNTITWTAAGDLLFVDKDDNAIIAVTDCRNSDAQDLSYSLYKVSSTGEFLWGDDGIDLSNGMAFSLVANMKMAQLEDGSYVCAWQVVDYSDNSHIQMQRISSTGALLWGAEGISLSDNSVSYEYPYLVSAGNNQVILVYIKGSGKHIMARKIDFDGSNVWAEDVAIYRGGFTIPPLWVVVRVISDEMGGAFVGWYDDRNWENKESTYVSHVTANGKLGFASGEGGERVGYNEYLRSFAPEMYFNKDEMALYVAYRETSQGQSWQQMTGQKLKIPSGELMWDPDGLEISPLAETSISFYSIQGGKNGNVAVFYTSCTWDPEYFYGWDINHVMLLNSHGEYVWSNEIIDFATIPSAKGSLASTPLLNNKFWVTAWSDNRALNGKKNSKIYLQRINYDGTLGPENSIKEHPKTASFMAYPTVVNGPVTFHVNAENSGQAEINLYSVMGQKIETIYSGMLHSGNNIISWNAQQSSLSKGVYFVTLTLNSEKKSLRLIINH